MSGNTKFVQELRLYKSLHTFENDILNIFTIFRWELCESEDYFFLLCENLFLIKGFLNEGSHKSSILKENIFEKMSFDFYSHE